MQKYVIQEYTERQNLKYLFEEKIVLSVVVVRKYLSEKSEINFDKNAHDADRLSASEINQLPCSLENAIFSKYISDYLIEKIEEIMLTSVRSISWFTDVAFI